MSLSVLLFILRLVSAVCLLGFLIFLAWLIMQDLNTATRDVNRQKWDGRLRVISAGSPVTTVGSEIPLTKLTTIGRSFDNTLALTDDTVSAHHARIHWRDGRYWFEDLDSRNGCLLNDIPLDEMVVLSNGDILTIGQSRFQLELKRY